MLDCLQDGQRDAWDLFQRIGIGEQILKKRPILCRICRVHLCKLVFLFTRAEPRFRSIQDTECPGKPELYRLSGYTKPGSDFRPMVVSGDFFCEIQWFRRSDNGRKFPGNRRCINGCRCCHGVAGGCRLCNRCSLWKPDSLRYSFYSGGGARRLYGCRLPERHEIVFQVPLFVGRPAPATTPASIHRFV